MTTYDEGILEITSALDAGRITLDRALHLISVIEWSFPGMAGDESATPSLFSRHAILEAAHRNGTISDRDFLTSRAFLRSQMEAARDNGHFVAVPMPVGSNAIDY